MVYHLSPLGRIVGLIPEGSSVHLRTKGSSDARGVVLWKEPFARQFETVPLGISTLTYGCLNRFEGGVLLVDMWPGRGEATLLIT